MDATSSSAMPQHVAFIMDGNGRWAQARGLPRIEGHRQGAQTVRRILKKADKLGVRIVTLYTFSTENWSRPKEEVEGLMKLLEFFLKEQTKDLVAEQTQLRVIGEISRLPLSTQKLLNSAIEQTQNFSRRTVVLALSYSGRDEMLRAVNKMIAQRQPLNSWKEIAQNLDTAGLPDPDLIIRTSGEMRLSNFMMLQGAYSELFFSPTPWPDFSENELEEILVNFSHRQRRFGKTGQQVSA